MRYTLRMRTCSGLNLITIHGSETHINLHLQSFLAASSCERLLEGPESHRRPCSEGTAVNLAVGYESKQMIVVNAHTDPAGKLSTTPLVSCIYCNKDFRGGPTCIRGH